MSRVPKVGDEIRYVCAVNGELTGVVRQLLGMQFVFVHPDGHAHFCLYSEKWERLRGGVEVPEEIVPVVGNTPSVQVQQKRKVKQRAEPEPTPRPSVADTPVQLDMAEAVNQALAEESTDTPPVAKPKPLPGETMLAYMKRIKGLAA